MKKAIYIGLCVMSLAACKTTSSIPIDDAYHWNDSAPVETVSSSSSSQSSETSQSSQSSQSGQSTPTLEVISAQDTTITVRIKR